MRLGSCILVVDDSRCMREVLGQILRPHCSALLFAGTYCEAAQQLKQEPEPDVVICDVLLPDGNGFGLLEEIVAAGRQLPKFLLITARWVDADQKRARDLGAVGYLAKPVSLQDIRKVLAIPAQPRERDARERTFLEAWVVDPQRREQLLTFEIHNISTSGMLLDTKGPLPVGTPLEFEIVWAEGDVVRGRGSVVRAQESSWLDASGSAVRFEWIESGERLAQLIRLARQAPQDA